MPNPQGVVDTNAANKTVGKHIHNYSTFDRSLSYRVLNTHRFGDYTPTFVMEGVPKDEIALNSKDTIDSLGLKAPFKGSIRKIKESFMVPNMAILPNQWDRIYAQNSNGDDVPVDANCVLVNFPTTFSSLFSACIGSVAAVTIQGSSTVNSFLTGLMRTLVLGEYVYSSGSLLNVLGYKSYTQFGYSDTTDGILSYLDYDTFFDKIITDVFANFSYIQVTEPVGSGTVVHQYSKSISGLPNYESFRAMIELFRENPLCYISSYGISGNMTETQLESYLDNYQFTNITTSKLNFYLPSSSYSGDPADITSLNPNILNLTRLLSYQLVCAHFYSNSSVDFIYSAELYREYIHYLFRSFLVATSYVPSQVDNFSWNGMVLLYDHLSGHILIRGLSLSSNTAISLLAGVICNSTSTGLLYSLSIYAAIFGFRKSLRYGDYFTASRPRPLAPINTDVSVSSNKVSVIDITRNIQAQRFANAVMRSRSKIEEYVKGLFGSAPAPDYHNPFFLSREEEFVFGDYVQNTAANTSQPQTRSANFATNLNRFTFTFHGDDMHPCTFIQIVSYDSPRAYCRSVDRQFLHADRFDMFNPDFQYIGDQSVYGIELGYHGAAQYQIPDVFSYQSRDMEYKQRFDQCAGGFVNSLPGWSFNDNELNQLNFANLSPDFIRSRNTDLDYLYISLTGYSLGKYFHFVCVTDNNVRAKRAMAVDPQILA